jgi:phytanoyl-CoA hydroxylase
MSFNEKGFALSQWRLPEALVAQASAHVEAVVQEAVEAPDKANFWSDFRASAQAAKVLFQEGREKAVRTAIRYGHALHHADPIFAALIAHEAVQQSLEGVLGSGFSILQAAVVRKPPGLHEAQFGWHQDAWYLPSEGTLALAFIALDTMTLENGCLEVIANRGEPRSHTLRLGARGFEPVSGRDPKAVDARDALALPMSRGEIALLHGHTFHASGPNQSAAPRRALIVHALAKGAHLEADAWLRTAP